MTNEQIVAMIQSGDGDRSALMEQLYQQNCGFIYKWSARYACGSITREDLMQEGYIALTDAVETFKDGRGSFVGWYKWHLMNRFGDVVGDGSRLVSYPLGRREQIRKWKKEYDRYCMVHGSEPSIEIMCGIMNVSLGVAERIAACVANEYCRSLDAPIVTEGNDEGSLSLVDAIADSRDRIGEAEDQLAADQIAAGLWAEVERVCDEKAAGILHAHFVERKTFTEIGQEYGVSRAAIDKSEKMALRRMWKKGNVKRLRSYLDAYSAGMSGVGVHRFRETGTSATERVALKMY